MSRGASSWWMVGFEGNGIMASAAERAHTHDARAVRITAAFEARWLERVRSPSPVLQVEQRRTESAETIADGTWRDGEIGYTSYATPAPALKQARRLHWVLLDAAGIDQVIDHTLLESPNTFMAASGVDATAVLLCV